MNSKNSVIAIVNLSYPILSLGNLTILNSLATHQATSQLCCESLNSYQLLTLSSLGSYTPIKTQLNLSFTLLNKHDIENLPIHPHLDQFSQPPVCPILGAPYLLYFSLQVPSNLQMASTKTSNNTCIHFDNFVS